MNSDAGKLGTVAPGRGEGGRDPSGILLLIAASCKLCLKGLEGTYHTGPPGSEVL